MCGRYYLDLKNLLNEEYELSGEITYETNFNITPQSQVPIIIENKLIIGTWGYYPDWLKKQKNSKPLFNTRWETIQEKRTFQTAFKKHRCLVPISGWYEWKNVDNEKHPYFFHNEKNILKAAALYWKRSNGDIEFSIITQEAFGTLATIHNRTPLILSKEKQVKWVSDLETESIYQDISNQQDIVINFHRVSKSVNNPKNQNSSLINEYTEVPF